MSMTIAEIKTSVFCDLETYLCPRTVLVVDFVNPLQVVTTDAHVENMV
jgi:hypothetical protein